MPVASEIQSIQDDGNTVHEPHAGALASGVFGRMGIRGKLLSAFALVSALTLLATGASLVSYHGISADLRQIEQDSLPGMSHALVLGRQAAELSSTSVVLAASESPADLQKTVTQLTRERQAMTESLDRLAATAAGRGTVETLRVTVNALNTSTDALADSVALRLKDDFSFQFGRNFFTYALTEFLEFIRRIIYGLNK